VILLAAAEAHGSHWTGPRAPETILKLMALELVVAGFSQNSAIPRSHTCEGADLSPAIEWKAAPETTQSFALIVADPDAPGRTWNHWLLYDISPSVHSLDPGFKARNDGRKRNQ
jgi:phosphatidylethanolamine-binding protein (PEBP) family uncharacterized protein